MKFMEKKIVANIIKGGKIAESVSVKCFGNASFRVFFGNTPVDYIFRTEREAKEYGVNYAKGTGSVLLGLATAEIF